MTAAWQAAFPSLAAHRVVDPGFCWGSLAVSVLGVSALLRTQRFHDYVLIEVQKSASQRWAFRWSCRTTQYTSAESVLRLTSMGWWCTAAAPFSTHSVAAGGARAYRCARGFPAAEEVVLERGYSRPSCGTDPRGLSRKQQSSPLAEQGASNGVQPLFDLAIRHALLEHGSDLLQ